MDSTLFDAVVAEECKAKEWDCALPLDISTDSSKIHVVDILDYVEGGSRLSCIVNMSFCSSENGFPTGCYFQFPLKYFGSDGYKKLKDDLMKTSRQSGFELCVSKARENKKGNTKTYTFSCKRKQQ